MFKAGSLILLFLAGGGDELLLAWLYTGLKASSSFTFQSKLFFTAKFCHADSLALALRQWSVFTIVYFSVQVSFIFTAEVEFYCSLASLCI